jgi:hypothetical protein
MSTKRDIVGDVRNVNLGTRVEADLAIAVRRLAALANRTVSRELADAVRRRVLLSEIPVERDETPTGGLSSSSQLAGKEKEMSK